MTDSIEISFLLSAGDVADPYAELVETLSKSDGYQIPNDNERKDHHSSVIRSADVANFICDLIGHDAGSDWSSLPSAPAIELEVGSETFTVGDAPEQQLETVLEVVETIYSALDDCIFGYGLDIEHIGSLVEGRELGKPMTDESLAENRINEVSWLMLFGPELVAEYGREWLLSAPAWKREELDDGAILLVASPDPTDYEQFSEDRDILRTYFDRRGNDSE